MDILKKIIKIQNVICSVLQICYSSALSQPSDESPSPTSRQPTEKIQPENRKEKKYTIENGLSEQ